MIVLDTNVISELWKREPDPAVLAWIDAQVVESLYLASVTVAELRFGIAAMPAGKRRAIYHDRLEREVLPVFRGRILPFDLETSKNYATLMANARAGGRAIAKEDGYIAATAHANGMMIATRDVSPFEAAGLSIINPWEGNTDT